MNRPFGSFSMVTLGCKVNQYDTQSLRETLEARGLIEVPFDSGADLAVVNTCAVTSEAVRKSRVLVRRARRANPSGAVAVTGCAASEQADTFAAELGVTLVAGRTADLAARLESLLPEARPSDQSEEAIDTEDCDVPYIGGETGFSPLPMFGETFRQSVSRFDGHRRAFLKVQDGCDCYCSFCIIPFLRGTVRSKPIGAVVAEAKALIAAGHREIVLTGVHLGAYGREPGGAARRWAGPGKSSAECDDPWRLNQTNRLADLVEAMLEIPGPWRLRLSSLEATEVTDRLIALMRRSGKMCPHLHLPLQSGSSRILHRMNRRYSADDFVRVVDSVRAAVPDCSISTDVIVGFPGETEEHFAETLDVARRCGFSRVHVFPYSVRPGTAASSYGGHVSAEEKKDRVRRLTAVGDELAAAYHGRFAGSTAEVLLELGDPRATDWAPRVCTGLTRHYGEVDVALPEGVEPHGELFDARLTAFADGRFRAEML